MTQKEISAVFNEMRSLCTYRNILGREKGFDPCNNCVLRKICWVCLEELTNKDITNSARGLKKWSERR